MFAEVPNKQNWVDPKRYCWKSKTLKITAFKGKLRSKKMKEREKCKNEPSLTSMRQMVLEISNPKVMNLSKMDVAIL